MEQDDNNRVTEYARKGAAARLAELMAEIEFIYRQFPQLRRTTPVIALGAEAPPRRRPRRNPKWTAAMKKAAADRMKRYWAARRVASRKSSS